MKKLLCLEFSVARLGFLLAFVFYFILLFTAIYDDGIIVLYYMPSTLTSLVLVRAIINFDRYDMDKFYMLLPVKVSRVIGLKYVFYNVLLLLFTIIVSITHLAVQSAADIAPFSPTSAFVLLAMGFFVINAALLEYYLIGPADTQVVLVVNLLVIMSLIKPIMRSHITLNASIIIALAAIGISILFYICTCIYVSANANGRINISEKISGASRVEREERIKWDNSSMLQRLFWLEWLVSWKGLVIGAALAVIFFAAACTGVGGEYYLYSLPSFIAVAVLMRSAIRFDKEGINKLLILLPMKIKDFVGTKYLFYNGLLFAGALMISAAYFVLSYFGILFEFNPIFLLLNLCFGFALVNLALLGYYFLGAVNMQFFMFAGYLGAFWFSRQTVGMMLGSESLLVLLIGLIGLVWCMYKLSCLCFSTHAFGTAGFFRKRLGS